MEYEIRQDKKFRYIEEGSGHPLILLHGLFGALSNWKDVLEKFSPKYKVVIPLMPIYDMPILLTNVRSLSKFVHRFITYKGYESYSLIGNSLGGHVALVYATKHPEKVRTLTLTGSSGLYENSSMGGTYPRRGDREFIKEKVEYTFYSPESATKELVDEVFEIVNNRVRIIKILALAKSAIRHNMKKEIVKITAPTCLIWGKEDRITPPEVAEEFHRLIPHSDLFWLDKCGHAPMMERPKEFNEILEKWLDEKLR
jgi:pimeloyl-ACP methyl ester carboxylesterase